MRVRVCRRGLPHLCQATECCACCARGNCCAARVEKPCVCFSWRATKALPREREGQVVKECIFRCGMFRYGMFSCDSIANIIGVFRSISINTIITINNTEIRSSLRFTTIAMLTQSFHMKTPAFCKSKRNGRCGHVVVFYVDATLKHNDNKSKEWGRHKTDTQKYNVLIKRHIKLLLLACGTNNTRTI